MFSSIKLPIATALQESLRSGYKPQDLLRDLIAGLVVSFVALPLSIALSIAVGLGPREGIATAIIAGIATALLGGSRTQVSGPTAAFVVILAPIVATHGYSGLVIATLFAGIALVAMGVAGLGQFVSYIPYPVTTGFTSGIAVVLATLSLNDFFGLGVKLPTGHYIDKVTALASAFGNFKWQETLVGVSTLTMMFLWPKISRKIPSTLVAVMLGTALSIWLNNMGYKVVTIGEKFTLPDAANLFTGLGTFSLASIGDLKPLLIAGLVIAALAATESLLSATVADSMAGTKHNPNSELIGIGIGNILCGFFGGIPATGAIARTATAIRSGAKTPIAPAAHAVLVLLYALLLSKWIGMLPMTALAALLINTAFHMSHYRQFISILRHADKSAALTLLTCFTLTVFVDMVAGVIAGIVLASFLFMKEISEITKVHLTGDEKTHTTSVKIPEGVMVYTISGPLFFGTAEKALDRASFMTSQIKVMVIDITGVTMIDMTGLVALESLMDKLASLNIGVVFCGSHGLQKKFRRKLAADKHTIPEFADTLDEGILKAYKKL